MQLILANDGRNVGWRTPIGRRRRDTSSRRDPLERDPSERRKKGGKVKETHSMTSMEILGHRKRALSVLINYISPISRNILITIDKSFCLRLYLQSRFNITTSTRRRRIY
jgi:hypothetical protein